MATQNKVYMQVAHNIGVVVDQDLQQSAYRVTIMLGAGVQGVTLAKFTITGEEYDILHNAATLGALADTRTVDKLLKRVEREACENANIRLAKLILKEGK